MDGGTRTLGKIMVLRGGECIWPCLGKEQLCALRGRVGALRRTQLRLGWFGEHVCTLFPHVHNAAAVTD